MRKVRHNATPATVTVLENRGLGERFAGVVDDEYGARWRLLVGKAQIDRLLGQIYLPVVGLNPMLGQFRALFRPARGDLVAVYLATEQRQTAWFLDRVLEHLYELADQLPRDVALPDSCFARLRVA